MADVLAAVRAAFDAVVLDPGSLSDDEVRAAVGETQRLERRLRLWQARLIGEVDQRQLASRDGCASPAAWLSQQVGLSSQEAARRQDEAAAVAASPQLAQALDRGEITPEHARTILTTTRAEPDMDVEDLLTHARTLDAGRFAHRAGQLRRAHQADGGMSAYEAQRRARRCTIRVRPEDGMVVLHAELDPLTGARIRAALFSEADRLWRAEHADGDDAPAAVRTNPQRLADALANLSARPAPAGLGPETVEVLVAIDYDALVGATDTAAQIAGIGLIPAATARRVACEAGILPAVLGGGSELLDLGRSRRLANRAQRRALRHRHPTCAIPGCEVPFDWCQIHHLRPWSAGGRTDLDHLAPVCNAHHHLVHEGGWLLTRHPDGHLEFVPPRAVCPPAQDRPRLDDGAEPVLRARPRMGSRSAVDGWARGSTPPTDDETSAPHPDLDGCDGPASTGDVGIPRTGAAVWPGGGR